MFEIFITVVAAIVVGAIVVKFWRPILKGILIFLVIVFSLIILIPMYILSIPVRIYTSCVSDEKLQENIVCSYDHMFYEASGQEELTKDWKKIKWAGAVLKQREEKKFNKWVKNLLEEAKWVL